MGSRCDETDFVSLHITRNRNGSYDYGVNIQEDVINNAIDRMMDQIYWASTFWSDLDVEETGFTSSDDSGSLGLWHFWRLQ